LNSFKTEYGFFDRFWALLILIDYKALLMSSSPSEKIEIRIFQICVCVCREGGGRCHLFLYVCVCVCLWVSGWEGYVGVLNKVYGVVCMGMS